MHHLSAYIQLGSERLHYLQTGTGKRVLLAFHGYGEDAHIFSAIEPYLTAEFTLLSFDLPHHGSSQWGDSPVNKKQLVLLVDTVRKQYGVEKVSLLGYSLGGRVCLSIVESIPESIERTTLLASDGLVKNSYYSFFTGNPVGKKIFRSMLEKPAPYFKIMDWLHNRNLVHPSRYKFAMLSLGSPESRSHLLNVWPAMRLLVPAQARLKRAIKDHNIPVALFMGANDKIMPPRLAEQFKDGLPTVQLHIVERGHRVFDHENAAQIAKTLLA